MKSWINFLTFIVYILAFTGNSSAVDNSTTKFSYTENIACTASTSTETTREVFIEQAKLTSPDPQEKDQFAFGEIAIGGDFAFVGASGYDSSTGCVFIYKKGTDDIWSFHAKIQPLDCSKGVRFGKKISIDSDVVLISAGKTMSKQQDDGCVYVFRRSNEDEWIEEAKIRPSASDMTNLSNFGFDFCVSGDNAIISTKPMELNSNMFQSVAQGTVFIYSRGDDANWSQTSKLMTPNERYGEDFGWSVHISGNTAIVSDPGEITRSGISNRNSGMGCVYVYNCDKNGDWTLISTLTASDRGHGHMFGREVCLSNNTIMVSAWGQGGRRWDVHYPRKLVSGSVYFFRRTSSGLWKESQRFSSPNIANAEKSSKSWDVRQFDRDMFAWGDIILDGDSAIVKAKAEVYIYRRTGYSWQQAQKIRPTVYARFFGTCCDISNSTVMVGDGETVIVYGK